MKTIQITLSDQLAYRAEEAGLLSTEFLEKVLRQNLETPTLRVFEAVDRGNADDDSPYMSPEEAAEEIALMRAERGALKPAC